MRFMMLVKSDAQSEAGALPDEKILTAMGKYNEELVTAGAMLAGEGLQASSKGARVRIAGGETTVVDGPFAEAKELVAGYWIIEARSLADAVDWAKRAPFQGGEVEVRPVFGPEDFPVDPTETPDGWRAQEQAAREAAAVTPPARKPGTTRYVVMLKADKQTESGVLPDQKAMAAMGALMQEAVVSGALLAGDGLKASSKGARVRYAGEKRTVTDGPFTESKELIAGFSLVQFASRAEAIEFARRMLQIHVDWSGMGRGEIEIRQLFELSDFPADPTEKPDGWRQQEERLRARLG